MSTYNSKPGPIEEVCGTYKLSKYEKKDENGENYDYKSANGISAYMIVKEDGYGYYFYKDNVTPLKSETTLVTFINDEEKTELIKSIDVTTGADVKQWDKKVGCGDEPQMGFNVKNHTLNWTIHSGTANFGTKEVEYSTVHYTRISADTSFETVGKELNTTIAELPRYELKRITSPLVLVDNQSATMPKRFEYFIVDIDTIKQTADIYYQKVGGEEIAINNYDGFEITFGEANGNKYAEITLDKDKTGEDILIGHNFTGYCDYKKTAPSIFWFNDEVWQNDTLNMYYGESKTISEIIAELKSINNNAE